MTPLSWTVFTCRVGGQYHPEQYSEARMDYVPASLRCPPTAADLPQSDDNQALSIIVRKQLDNIISRHVHHGQSHS